MIKSSGHTISDLIFGLGMVYSWVEYRSIRASISKLRFGDDRIWVLDFALDEAQSI